MTPWKKHKRKTRKAILVVNILPKKITDVSVKVNESTRLDQHDFGKFQI